MAWSTRELAELAGTTVNTVRHYHRLGLLDEPERRANGYKQYDGGHLVRLLQIRRLRDLGVPLAEIRTIGLADSGASTRTLRELDAGLTANIEKLHRARAEIRAILDRGATTDVPAGFEEAAVRMSPSDRSLTLVSAQLYDDLAMTDIRRMVEAPIENPEADADFDRLASYADESTRQRIAEGLAPQLAQHLVAFPWLLEPSTRLSTSRDVAGHAFAETLASLYNAAQLDVLIRASALARERLERG